MLNRPTGQRGNKNVANAETLHHFLNSGIDNIHDITRPNIGNSILQPITLDADLGKAGNSVNYSRASISKPLALGIDPKIKTKIWAQEYIDLGCLLNKKQSKVKDHVMWLLIYMIVLIENGANMIKKVYHGTKSIMN